jgi:acyl-ACP thioesterase
VIEFIPFEARGRSFSAQRRVRLSDADSDGTLRPDGVARYLQDVATDDWDDTGVASDDTWLVRRTAWRVAPGGRWPLLGEMLTMTTWCSGTGAAWAERRTNLALGEQTLIEAVALWVPVDLSGRPRRVRADFFDVYGEAANGRRVSGRIPPAAVAESAVLRPWPLRRSDLDVVGHVNNAALWYALSEVASARLTSASITHYGAVEGTDAVTLASDHEHLWLVVEGDVRVSGEFSDR